MLPSPCKSNLSKRILFTFCLHGLSNTLTCDITHTVLYRSSLFLIKQISFPRGSNPVHMQDEVRYHLRCSGEGDFLNKLTMTRMRPNSQN